MTTDTKIAALQAAGGDLEKAKAIYAWLTDAAPVADKPKADTKAATKPKTEASKETPKSDPVETQKTEMSYAADVQPKVIATVAGLVEKGKNGKDIVQGAMKEKFGVTSAKEVPADKWPELLTLCADLLKADEGVA